MDHQHPETESAKAVEARAAKDKQRQERLAKEAAALKKAQAEEDEEALFDNMPV